VQILINNKELSIHALVFMLYQSMFFLISRISIIHTKHGVIQLHEKNETNQKTKDNNELKK
jgi:hypothetical protein